MELWAELLDLCCLKEENKLMDYWLSGADEKKPKNNIMPEEYNSAVKNKWWQNILNEIMKRRKL